MVGVVIGCLKSEQGNMAATHQKRTTCNTDGHISTGTEVSGNCYYMFKGRKVPGLGGSPCLVHIGEVSSENSSGVQRVELSHNEQRTIAERQEDGTHVRTHTTHTAVQTWSSC